MDEDPDLPEGLRDCFRNCLTCAEACMQAAMNWCLDSGNSQFDDRTFRLLLSCADLCKVTATVIRRQVPEHVAICATCADVCTACVKSCESSAEMEDLTAACRQCAACCRALVASSTEAQSGGAHQR